MKALNLPLTHSSAAPAAPADFAAPLPAEADTQNFSDLMGQAMAFETASETAESLSDAPVKSESPTEPEIKTNPTAPATISSFELLAAMVLPVPTPIVTPPGLSTLNQTATATSVSSETIGSAATRTAETGTLPSGPAPTVPDAQARAVAATLSAPFSAPVPTTPVSQPESPLTALPGKVSPEISTTPDGKVSVAPELTVATGRTLTETVKPLASQVAPGSTSLRESTPATLPPTDAPGTAEQKLPDTELATDSTEMSAKLDVPEQMNPRPGFSEGNLERGTSGAKYTLPMQKAEKMNESAGTAEQDLPIKVTEVAVPLKAARFSDSALGSTKAETSGTMGSSTTDMVAVKETNSRIESAPAVNPLRTIERTQDLIAVHAYRLRDSSRDSMQVVLKPSPDLHIALNLQMRDGAVEVTAQLQRGDFELLNRHWSDLQQQMEARGVRLAPLSNQNHSLNSNSSFSQQSGRQSQEEKTTKTGPFAEFALANVLVSKRTNKVIGARGWESWA
ncbi:MAG: hypothetical protein H7Y43_06070 [Akkermansiaceae bacterium]|nr:hypothetical protein [Verrucomicrobiales bacterium]